jgi:hypothetical protein
MGPLSYMPSVVDQNVIMRHMLYFVIFMTYSTSCLPPILQKCGGRDSSVGIATRYGPDGPGIESWWWRDFPRPSKPDLGPTQPPKQ